MEIDLLSLAEISGSTNDDSLVSLLEWIKMSYVDVAYFLCRQMLAVVAKLVLGYFGRFQCLVELVQCLYYFFSQL